MTYTFIPIVDLSSLADVLSEAIAAIPDAVNAAVAGSPTVVAAATAAVTAAVTSNPNFANVPVTVTWAKDIITADQAGNEAFRNGVDGVTSAYDLHARHMRFGQSKDTTANGRSGFEIVQDATGYWIKDLAGNVAWGITLNGREYSADPFYGRPQYAAPAITRVIVNMMAGQSNGAGYGAPSGLPMDRSNNQCLMYNWTTAQLVPMTAQIAMRVSSDINGLGPLNGITAAQLPLVDNQTVVVNVNAGVGGSGLDNDPAPGSWKVGYAGPQPALYPGAKNAFVSVLAQVAAAYPSATIEPYLFWHQGEADSSTTTSAYSADLVALIAQFRTDLGLPTLPVVAGGMSTTQFDYDDTSGRANIRRALIGVETATDYYAYVDAPWNAGVSRFLTDGTHINRKGTLALGASMWEVAEIAAASGPAAWSPHLPETVQATVVNNVLRVWWSAPDVKVTAYTCQYSTDAGTTWSTLTWSGPANERRRMATGMSASSYLIRVGVTNAVGTPAYYTYPVPALRG